MMFRMANKVTPLLLMLPVILAACTIDVPEPVAVQLIQHAGPLRVQMTTLSPEQRVGLVAWLAKHQSGWAKSYASYAPSRELRLTHADASVSVINIVNSKVVAYGNFGQFERVLTSAERSQLESALGLRQDSTVRPF